MAENTRELFDKLPESRKKEIMDAVLTEIARKNLSGATVRGIAGRLGISHGSLFHYFRSKDAMVDELISSGYRHQDRLFTSDLDPSLSCLEQIMSIAGYSLEFARENPVLVAFWIELGLPSNEKYTQYNIDGELSSIKMLKKIIRTGIDSGEFRDNIDPSATAFIIDGMLSNLLKSSISSQEKIRFSEFFPGGHADSILKQLEQSLEMMLLS